LFDKDSNRKDSNVLEGNESDLSLNEKFEILAEVKATILSKVKKSCGTIIQEWDKNEKK
jgi:hypothetical protein